jgi:hypothetical protein
LGPSFHGSDNRKNLGKNKEIAVTERQKALSEAENLVRRILAKRGYDKPKDKDVRVAAKKVVKAIPTRLAKELEHT